jgi:peptide/nickel transport system permease protein
MERKSFNELLKEKELLENKQHQDDGHLALDDAKRVKVLSPGQLVFKRFIRNKLAIFGTCVLIFMFLFAFIVPLFYPYSQTQVFFKYDYVNGDYATASMRTDYTNHVIDSSVQVDSNVQRNITASIEAMKATDASGAVVTAQDGTGYAISKLGDGIYTLSLNQGGEVATFSDNAEIGTYNLLGKSMDYTGDALGEDFSAVVGAAIASKNPTFTYEGQEYTWTMVKKMNYSITRSGASVQYTGLQAGGADFEAAAAEAIAAGKPSFEYDMVDYALTSAKGGTVVTSILPGDPILVSSVYVIDAIDHSAKVSSQLLLQSLLNAYTGESFEADGQQYQVKNENGEMMLYTADGQQYGLLTNFVVRDASGDDTLDLAFKEAAQAAVSGMAEKGVNSGSFTYQFPEMTTRYEGIEPIIEGTTNPDGTAKMKDTTVSIAYKAGNYQLTCFQWKHLIDISDGPSARHAFGTDTDGMDILARMMYGGRISLCVGFIVVFIETFLGVIMGGIAGYFGGWVDNLIMRIVDIFYCIPSLPILIILGSFMDAMKLGAYVRLAYMMAVLGILGWASVARLVRGQILSLREQEFMVATEATGIRVKHRIFKHLMPNVMPQLIVTATASLGSVIILESTLSFLGLGVKHPLATWGTMINSVTASNENLIKYTYIWVPVGALICFTVIAFNFVGDGLRDAFDPKMKR